MHPVAAAGFASAADVYERARPSYPPEAVAWIAERARLGPGRTVLDVGAGTGKLTRLLVPTGARVIAVEPLAEMRAKLEEVVPGVVALEGTAEELPLGDGAVDVVTCAQAFHWFDLELALPELHRVLRPTVCSCSSGTCATSAIRSRARSRSCSALTAAPSRRSSTTAGARSSRRRGSSAPIERRTFGFDQRVTVADVVGRVASTSFVAAMPEAERRGAARAGARPGGRPRGAILVPVSHRGICDPSFE